MFGHHRIILLVLPCTFALFALGFTSVNLLFGRGNFSPVAVIQTTLCLWAYGLSLLPSTLVIYQSSLLYAYRSFKIPTIASLISVAANLVLNTLFVFFFHWGIISIALSTSFSSCLNYLILKNLSLRKGYLRTPYPNISIFWKLFVSSFISFLVCIFIDYFFLNAFNALVVFEIFFQQFFYFFGQMLSFITAFVLSLFLLDKQMFFVIKNFIFLGQNLATQDKQQ